MKSVQALIVSVALFLLMSISACSTHIPPEIKQPIEGAPGVGEVRDTPDAYLSQKVRWGGVILDTKNTQDSSSLTVVAFPLSNKGEPQVSDQSTGRFIAIIDQFLEPTVFTAEREITVTGTLLKTQTRDVGEFPYEYPVVQVQNYYIWPVKVDPTYVNYPPYWWYDPWYPYYPLYYPHHYPHHHHRHH
ncbi:MAG: Slp family lipoprotein [Gammaproteobacteria bacterium]